MKRSALIALMAGLSILYSNSGVSQSAGFTYTFTNGGCNPDSVVFTNTSTGAHTYLWDFGDFGPNDTSTAVDPYYIYLWDNTYTVQLIAYDTILGDSDIAILPVTIGFTPFPGWAWFNAMPNPVCPGDKTEFNSFMFPPPTFSVWDFDDGDSSTLARPLHAFADTGIYMVTYIAGNGCGSDTVTNPVGVDTNSAIFASWWADPNPACPGQAIAFNNTTFPDPVAQIWDFGDGDSAFSYNAMHTYPDTGTYAVKLIVFSSCNSDTQIFLVTVDTSLVPFVNSSAGPNPVCPGDAVNFQGFGNNLQSFFWDFGDSGISVQRNPSHVYADTGLYPVIFVGTNFCGNTDTANLMIVVGDSFPPSFVSFWTNPNSFCSTFSNICPGTPVSFTNNTGYADSYFWDFGDGDTSILEEPVHAFPDTGTYNVTLIATTACNGVDSVTNCVYVTNDASPNAFFCTTPFCFPLGPICPGTPVFFTNNSSDTAMCFWDFGDGDTSVAAEPMHVFADTGSFTVILKITNGCGKVAYDAEVITVSYDAAPPKHDFWTFPNIACPGEIIDFSLFVPPFFIPVDTADVLWDFGDGNTSNITNPPYAYDSSGTFNVTVIVFTACGNDTATGSFTVKPGSAPDFTYTSVCLGDSVQFSDASSGSPDSYSWDFGDGDTSGVQNPLHKFDSAGVTYNVSLTVLDSGCVSGITKPVTVGAVLLSMSSTAAHCGQADGQASVSVAGGTPPYTYLWNDPGAQTTATASAVLPGPYEVIVQDAGGCQDTGYVVVGNLLGGLALISGSTNASCNGMCNGTATATMAGGTGPYTYSWSDPGSQTTVTASGLCAASFDVVITDAVGCKDTATVVITEPTALNAAISGSTGTSCNGVCDGTISASAAGGTAPYTYLWDDPGTQTTGTANGLCAGMAIVTVTDKKGCVDSAAGGVSEPLPLSLSMDSTDASCGNPNGSALVFVSGGTSPYTYAWDDPGSQTTDTASGIPAGTYQVVVTDSNGCTDSAVVTIDNITGPSAAISAINGVSCNGGSDGSATGSATGGSLPFSYAWDDPLAQTTATAVGLAAGSYEVTITDSLGCQDSAGALIVEPPLLTATGDSVDVTCFGVCDGQAIGIAAGGTVPYTFIWDDVSSQTTATAINLCAGSYNATITDANGCQVFVPVNVDEPTLLTSAITASNDASCNGVCDGDASAAAAGGTPPYTYLWDDPGAQTNTIATGLCAGPVIINVSDANGCTGADTVAISEPAAVAAIISGSNDASCNGACDGDATGSVSGGTAPYTYLWDDPGTQTGLTAAGLCAGSYNFAVEDANGCSDTALAIISEPVTLTAGISASSAVSCYGECDGDATGTAIGGTGPYTFLWDDIIMQTTATATSLCAGTFKVVITDANGCMDSATVVISEPALFSAAITDSTNNNCSGSCTGVATVTPLGGTPPYGYSWDAPGGQTDSTATGLCAGLWTVTLADANGCSDTATVNITEPTPIVPLMASGDASCGVPNGEASVSASGGVGPYTYLWDDPGAQTTDTATGLAAGAYSVDVTDSNSCSVTGMVNVGNTGAAVISIDSVTDVLCNGGSNGSAGISVSGGAPPYSYLWDDPASQSTATASALAAGTYTVTVTDSAGCITSAFVIVAEPAALTTAIAGSDVSCFGGSNGTAAVNPSGGTLPYTYQWCACAGSQTTQTATGLAAGTYYITVTDSNGCTLNDSVEVNQPTALVLSSSANGVSCFGSCDGDANVTAGGGTAPYTYLWNDPGAQTTATASGLCSGTYVISVSDSNACTTSDTVTLSEPAALLANITSTTDVNCNGNCDGDATGSVTGGIVPYTYLWDDPGSQTTLLASGLCAGTYNLSVSDSNGCSDTASAVITEPAVLAVGVAGSVDVTCNAACDGNAAGTVSGGSVPYTYQWDDSGSQTTSIASNLCAGTFQLVITDGNGCKDSAAVLITEPPALVASISSSNDASCNLVCDGDATAGGSGGSGSYYYAWDDGAAQSTNTAGSLCAGFYNVVVTDSSGCSDSASVVILEPTAISLSMAANDASCGVANGSASVGASGGTGSYSYLWNDPSAQTTDTAMALAAGAYTVTVTDGSGCTESGIVSVNNTGAATVSASILSNAGCFGAYDGSAVVSASGGILPYTYAWNDPGAQTTDTADGLAAGTYTVTVTDSAGCVASAIVIVAEPSALTLSASSNDVSCFGFCDGDASVIASGGTAPYTYSWLPGGCATPTCSNLCPGLYTVFVTDSNGCQDSASVSVSEPADLTASAAGTGPSCAGSCDGSATATAGGGTLPYSYLWTDSLGDTLSLAGNVTGLCAGNYGLTITDGNGCTGAAAVTIVDPLGMSLSFASSPASCGGADGAASVSVSNGTAPYSYLWDDPGVQTADTASAISAGSYNVTVTDAIGCMVTGNVIVANSGAPVVTVFSTNVSCNGMCDGTSTAIVSGGTTPYTYLWDDPGAGTNSTVTGLCAGIYTVMITDVNGCVATTTDTVMQPLVLTTTGSSVDPVCFGVCDGSVSAVGSGGTAPYSYLWDDPGASTNANTNSLCGGTYSVIVSDANGCSDSSFSLILTDPPAITVSTGSNDVSSCTTCDGSIIASGTGGTGALTYLWDDPAAQTNAVASGLCAAIYSVLVTDANGCSASQSDTVNSPGGLLATISGITAISCAGVCDGSAVAIQVGGTAPFTYLWNDPGTTANDTVTGLCAGTYAVAITDSAGCASSASITFSSPSALFAAVTSNAASCAGVCDGDATVSASGGTPPYAYGWSDPTFQTGGTANGLCGGLISVIVTDSNGCTATVGDSIGEAGGMVLSFTADTATAGVSDGTATVSVSGGTAPYTYSWDDAAAQTNSTATGLPGGVYNCTVTDANGCISSGGVTVQQAIGIFESDAWARFEVHPNPTTGMVELTLEPGGMSPYKVSVRNLIGEVLMESMNSGQITVKAWLNLGELPDGIYFIRVECADRSLNKKVVLTR